MTNNEDIFITQDEINKQCNCITGKITKTNVLDSIPNNSYSNPLNNWKQEKKIEWRWRFFDFQIGTLTVEISYLSHDSNKRIYWNKYGQWTNSDVPQIIDKYVVEEFYHYCYQ